MSAPAPVKPTPATTTQPSYYDLAKVAEYLAATTNCRSDHAERCHRVARWMNQLSWDIQVQEDHEAMEKMAAEWQAGRKL